MLHDSRQMSGIAPSRVFSLIFFASLHTNIGSNTAGLHVIPDAKGETSGKIPWPFGCLLFLAAVGTVAKVRLTRVQTSRMYMERDATKLHIE